MPAPASGVLGVLELGAGVVGTGAAAVVVGTAAAGGTVTVRWIVVVVEPEPEDSFTSDAASTPSESTATTAKAIIGAFQFEDAARRVRAAAPQRRHHSCDGSSGAPHSGQASPAAGPAAVRPGAPAPAGPAGGGGAAVVLTRQPRADG